MWVPVGVLLTGLIAVILATERYGLRFGGVVVVPLLAVYVLFDVRALVLFVISAATAYLVLQVIEKRIVLYGRRLFITAIAVGALVPVATFLLAQFVFESALLFRDIAYLGSILPGIAAYNLHRLDREDQVADVAGSLALVGGLVLLSAVLLVPRAALLGELRPEVVLGTASEMVLGRVGVVITPPEPIIPRTVTVGLFIVGLLGNEYARKRYGVRFAGVIAVPLIAVFSLQDLRLLGLYLGALAIAAAVIRLVHRSTFLYGRNLLGGSCIVGVVIAAATLPFLPAGLGLRPLIVGLLGGVSAYNGHVLAPAERVQSVLVSAGAFVVLYGIANWIALFLDRPLAHSIGLGEAVFGAVVLLTAAIVLVELEERRPPVPIEPIANGNDAIFPDGGPRADDDLVSDGGHGDPLAGRTVNRVDDNVLVVSRDRSRREDSSTEADDTG